MAETIYQFQGETLQGNKQRSLEDFRGQVLLIVNTASKCGFTPQYKGLEFLYNKYKDQGFEILGFPCNQFGKQEPGNNDEISQFCELNYGVTFPMFAKVDVNGAQAHPLFRHLKDRAPGVMGTKKIKWNFTKFLIGKDGKVIKRFSPSTPPEKIEAEVKRALQA